MKDSIRSSLDDAFQKLAAQKKAQEETAEAKKTRDAAFLEVFLEKQKEVIRPAMEEMLSELKRRGLSSKTLRFTKKIPRSQNQDGVSDREVRGAISRGTM